MIDLSPTLRQRRADRAAARQRRADFLPDLAMAICGIVFALVIAAPWIMIACQVTTRGPF